MGSLGSGVEIAAASYKIDFGNQANA